jgi:predicted DCC family thiol-disulfide oxidoreductase YuxK
MTCSPVILFDGVCNLCNGAVQFVIRHDPKGVFRFAALQSDMGRALLIKHHLDPTELHSIVVILDDKVYRKSGAALEIARRLSGGWRLFYSFKIVPKFLRDWLYDGIAANRYRWFGKKEQCMIPRPELQSRFLQ